MVEPTSPGPGAVLAAASPAAVDAAVLLAAVEEVLACATPQEAIDRAAAVTARLAGYAAALLTVTFPGGTVVGASGLVEAEAHRFRANVDRVSPAERATNRARLRELAWPGTDVVFLPGAARSGRWNVVPTDPERRRDGADGWSADDALYVLVRDAGGQDCGVLSLDQPLDGLTPTPDRAGVFEAPARVLRIVVPAIQARVASVRAERAERQAWRAQRSEVLGELSLHVAHDLNNLLMVIRGQAEMLLIDRGVTRDRGLQVVLDTCDRAAALTRRVLQVGRESSGPQVTDVDAAVRDLESMLRRMIAPRCTLVIEGGGEALPVNIVPAALVQIVLNLVVNARDAMPEGGVVTVRVAPVEEHGTGFVRIEVEDTGPGVPADVRDHVFEPFFTTRASGTGLGLAAVAGIVRRAGGRVRLADDGAPGARFVVDLPRA